MRLWFVTLVGMSNFVPQKSKQPDWVSTLMDSVRKLRTLEQVIQWGLHCPVESMVLEVVVQDEFNHDVVMNLRDSHFLVFDTN